MDSSGIQVHYISSTAAGFDLSVPPPRDSQPTVALTEETGAFAKLDTPP